MHSAHPDFETIIKLLWCITSNTDINVSPVDALCMYKYELVIIMYNLVWDVHMVAFRHARYIR
jgi:hypothetical protein